MSRPPQASAPRRPDRALARAAPGGASLPWLGASLALHVAIAYAVTRPPTPPASEEAARNVVLTGDTLDLPGSPASEAAVDLDEVVPTAAAAPAPSPEDGAEAAARRPARSATKKPPKAAAVGGENSEGGSPERFGAVGERGAVDVSTAVTRGFPQAASADPIWASTSFGPAGAVDVVIRIDDAGHLVDAQLEGGGSPALRQGLSRTLTLIRGRTFVARTATTRLRVVGTVSRDTVKNGSLGDVFAIGGSFHGKSGAAFFSLAIGRRVDVTVTER